MKCNIVLSGNLCLMSLKRGYNATEATKNIFCAKDEGAVDDSSVTRWFSKFCSGCRKLDDWERSSRLEVVLQGIKANLVSITQRVLVSFVTFKSQPKHLELPNCASHYQNIANHPSNIYPITRKRFDEEFNVGHKKGTRQQIIHNFWKV